MLVVLEPASNSEQSQQVLFRLNHTIWHSVIVNVASQLKLPMLDNLCSLEIFFITVDHRQNFEPSSLVAYVLKLTREDSGYLCYVYLSIPKSSETHRFTFNIELMQC